MQNPFMNTRAAFVNLFLVAMSIGACDSGSTGTPQIPSAAINGTWRITNITCNGQAGNTSVNSVYAPPNAETFTINDISAGAYSQNTAGCTLSVPAGFSYVGNSSGTMSLTIAGLISCSSSGCSTACGQFTSGAVTYHYNFSVSGNTATWTSTDGNDSTCTTASPAQGNPVVYTLVRQ